MKVIKFIAGLFFWLLCATCFTIAAFLFEGVFNFLAIMFVICGLIAIIMIPVTALVYAKS